MHLHSCIVSHDTVTQFHATQLLSFTLHGCIVPRYTVAQFQTARLYSSTLHSCLVSHNTVVQFNATQLLSFTLNGCIVSRYIVACYTHAQLYDKLLHAAQLQSYMLNSCIVPSTHCIVAWYIVLVIINYSSYHLDLYPVYAPAGIINWPWNIFYQSWLYSNYQKVKKCSGQFIFVYIASYLSLQHFVFVF